MFIKKPNLVTNSNGIQFYVCTKMHYDGPFLEKKNVCFINYIFTRTPEQRIDLRRCTTSEVTIVSMFTITVIRTIIHIH
jgi:hypothetical protein